MLELVYIQSNCRWLSTDQSLDQRRSVVHV